MQKQSVRRNESGIASLVIAILIVIVLSTIVLGFMQIIRRDQRRSLDRQLSQQAYYAAESGINDATRAIDQGYRQNKTTCGPTGIIAGRTYAFSGPTSNQLDGNNVKYTCLLINQTPSNIIKTLTTNSAKSFAINNGASGVGSITFTWKDAQDSTGMYNNVRTSATDSSFPPAGEIVGTDWASTGLVRLDLVPIPAAISRSILETGARSVFLYPNQGGAGVASMATFVSGEIIHGNCVSGTCTVTISGLSGNYYARTVAYYRDVALTVTATDSIGSPVNSFSNGQIVVDSTGKAADVTRRVQERIDPSENAIPDFAIASMDSFCKKFIVTPLSPDTVVEPLAADIACKYNP